MTLGILFSAAPGRWESYREPLQNALDARGIPARLAPDMPAAAVDYVVHAPNGPLTDFGSLPRLRAVLSLWAGVEGIVGNRTLKVPLTRMVDRGLEEGMVEWVTGQVLRHHLGIDALLAAQDGRWLPRVPPLARDRRIGILGLGMLGGACARALAALNFPVQGWSRRPRALPGIQCLSGAEGLDRVLAESEILVLLLPDTPQTRNLIDAGRLARMPQGAVILNPGRGTLIDDDALLAALDAGRIGHATLDVFRQEPLPPGHPFWGHPRVTVSPHVASETRPETAAEVIADNIALNEAGKPMRYVVDPAAGY